MITSEKILEIFKNSSSLNVYSNREKEELAFHLDDIINEMDSLIKIFKNETLDYKEFENVYQMIVIHWIYHMKELRKILKNWEKL